ncbi:hypothetical protein L198_07719 [Cryptococcus wingfieldii CBS 7118]|uniref:Uncharacterized protein n=1 Tax=Cryptococcus wingfieldii CBS 7118 TaxID=1295528 RepID=A0A1E3I1W9_9TREE|nr:hypothetical protein L198_07719 [Cryptococcus wingfieldii CBS 7118]ODN82497.1 hypothetical protein L198_07719 [Cryptococcus wingfieldii CBS 7118]
MNPTPQPVPTDPLASSPPSHPDSNKQDVVRAFAHVDDFWGRLDLSLYLWLVIFFGGNVGVLLYYIFSPKEGVHSVARKWGAIGFTLLATTVFHGSKPRIFQALAPFQVIRAWNSNFLEISSIPMTTVAGGAERDERNLRVYGMGKFCFHFIEFFSKIPYVLLNLQRVVSGSVVVVSHAKQCVVVG